MKSHRLIYFVIAGLLLGSFFGVLIHPNNNASASPTWYDALWGYCKKITIDHTKVINSLVNFPVLMNITDNDLKTNAQSDGDDICFLLPDNATKLDHEIEYWNSATGNLLVWINLTYISSYVDTVFYMYYGNPSCSSQQSKYNVWKSYKMVQHLNDSSTDRKSVV